METNTVRKDSARRATLDYLEGQIDIWNRTANYKKRVITVWRSRITWTLLIGATFGLLSEELNKSSWDPSFYIGDFHVFFEIHNVLAVLSAVFIALSTYAGAKVLSNDLEKSQLKARAAAEGLKVQGHLYAMKAPPYSGKNAEHVLFKRVEIILKEVSTIAPDFSVYKEKHTKIGRFFQFLYTGKRDPNDENRWIQRFNENMTFSEYLEERVQGQVHGYYRKKASEFQKTISKANAGVLVFGFIGVVIGSIGATYSPGLSMWIGLISTATASITSYLHANKYEFLLMSYVSTASQLELISARYVSMKTPSIHTQRRFVAETETIFATEHNAWISEIAGSMDEEIEDNTDSIGALEQEPIEGEPEIIGAITTEVPEQEDTNNIENESNDEDI